MMRCLCCLGSLVVLVLPAEVAAEDWPQWRGPRADGTWNAPKLPEKWPAGGPKRIWQQTLGGGYAGVAVADGRVYTMDRQPLAGKITEAAADGEERVVCIDAADGKLLWEHRYATRYGKLGGYSNGPRAMPTIHDGRVYTLGAVGHVYCLDARSGKILWTKDMVREHRARIPEWGFAASPLIDGTRIIVHTGAEPNGCLMALDRRTGAEVWRAVPDPAGYCTPILIQSRSGRQLVAWTPENVRGLDPDTGRVLWTVPYLVTYGVSIVTPIFQEDVVFVTGYWEGAKAIRLGMKPSDAELIWEDSRHLRGIMAQPLYRDGLVCSLDHKEGLVCVELQTGKKLWDDGRRMTPPGRNPQASMVWLNDGNRALILNSAGELILARLDRAGYQEQSRARILDGHVWSHPGFSGKRLYARSDGADRPSAEGPYQLVCVELTEGN